MTPPLTVAAVSQVPLLAAVAVTPETVSVPCPASVTPTGIVCALASLRDVERKRTAAGLSDGLRGDIQRDRDLLVVGRK